MRRAIPVLIFLGLAALLVAGLFNAPYKQLIPSPLVGKPMPEFSLSVLGSDGLVMTSQDLIGEPFILNVWASWCPACRVEHEEISRIAGLEVIPIYGLNYKDDPNDAQRWLGQFGNPYTASLQDIDGQVGIDFGVYGAPETFLIDAKGVIRHKFIGPVSQQDWLNELQPKVLEMLNEARS